MEYMYSIKDDCRLDCSDQEMKLIKIIKRLRHDFADYRGQLCIIKDDNNDYLLRAEDEWSAEGFAERFGYSEENEEAMLTYAREECGMLRQHGIIADFDLDEESGTMTIYADYPMTATCMEMNTFSNVCEKYYQEQLDKRKEIGTAFTKDAQGHWVKADTLRQICEDIVERAMDHISITAFVSEYNQRDAFNGIGVHISEHSCGFYVVYIGDNKQTPPFIENIENKERIVNMILFDLLFYLPVSENDKYFLRVKN